MCMYIYIYIYVYVAGTFTYNVTCPLCYITGRAYVITYVTHSHTHTHTRTEPNLRSTYRILIVEAPIVRPNVLQQLHRMTFAPNAERSGIEVASSHADCTSLHALSSDLMGTPHCENCTLSFEAITSCGLFGNPVADLLDLFRSVTLQSQVGLLRAVTPLIPGVIRPHGCSDDPGQHGTTIHLTESRVSQSTITRQNLS